MDGEGVEEVISGPTREDAPTRFLRRYGEGALIPAHTTTAVISTNSAEQLAANL
jgi:hypothetical protein